MTSKFEIRGLWFLPSKKDKKVPGTLSFDPVEGSYLELIGSFEDIGALYLENTPKNTIFIILGTSIDSEAITLYHCFKSSRKGQRFKRNEELGPPSEKYYANFVLKGFHFETEESLKFHAIKSSIQNLDEWVNITGFKQLENLDNLSTKSIRLEYELPNEIEFDLNLDYKGKISFSASTPTFTSLTHEYISQDIELEIISIKEISLEEIRKLLTRFQNFLILGIYKSAFPNKITLYNNNIQNDFGSSGKFRKPIEFYQTTSKRRITKNIEAHEMLFNYTQIKNSFPKVIKTWFEKYEKLSPAFNLLFEQFYNGTKFSENTFLNLAQSAETFHSRTNSHTKIPKSEYLKMKKAILESVTEKKYQGWLKEQFNFGNNLNLEQRLTELMEMSNNIVIDEIITNKSDFIKQVKHLRNYYTHYSSDLEKKLIPEKELMFLSEKLKMILVSAFLYEVGFPKETIDKLFENAKFNLFNHLKVE